MSPAMRSNDRPDAMLASHGGSRAIFGRYRVLARLGRGGMAEVFVTAAEGAAGVKKLAVVKRLRTDLTKDEDPESVEAEERFRSMFLAEAQLSARLNHPNIVHTYEVGEERGSLFIAMEYVEGQSLHALSSALRRAGTAIPATMAVRIVCEVLSGLHYAHELTDLGGERLVIVHRDVSPQNVMLTYDGGVKLVDFGVAKASRSSAATEVGTLKGKVRYMAPEQVAGATVDRRADIFAVGVLLWELLAQKRLVRGETDAQALLSLVQDDAPSLLVESPAIDPGLAAVVMRALSRSPEQRYQTAFEMRVALQGIAVQSNEQASSESIGMLVRTTFANDREKMADRVRTALARPADVEDDIVVDWGADQSIADSGASKPPSRSASRSIANRNDEPATVGAAGEYRDGLFSAPPGFVQEPPASRRRVSMVIPLVAFLAAVAGAGAVIFLFKDQIDAGAGKGMPLATTGLAEERIVPASAAPEPAPAPELPSSVAPRAEPSATSSAGKGQADKNYEKWAAKNAKSRDSKPEPAEPPPRQTAAAPTEIGEKGFLTIDTYPWTKVTVNGRTLGSTPLVKAPLAAGTYTVTLENPDEKITERVTITIKPGETVSKRLAF